MINIDKAIDIATKYNDGNYPQHCKEFKDFWMFVMAPPVFKNDTCYTGKFFPIVYKDDGEYDLYDITTDAQAFQNAKKVF